MSLQYAVCWRQKGESLVVAGARSSTDEFHSLDLQTPDRSSAIRASGLTPDKFATAERDFRSAVQAVSRPASSQSVVAPPRSEAGGFVSSQIGSEALRTSLTTNSSPLASKVRGRSAASGHTQQALLARAQAVQAGSLFDSTMRATESSTIAKKSRPQNSAAQTSEASVSPAITNTLAQTATLPPAQISHLPRIRPPKRKRMSRIVFGLDVASGQAILDPDEQAVHQRLHSLRRKQIQDAFGTLVWNTNTTWRYHDYPRDFLISISTLDNV